MQGANATDAEVLLQKIATFRSIRLFPLNHMTALPVIRTDPAPVNQIGYLPLSYVQTSAGYPLYRLEVAVTRITNQEIRLLT